MKNRNELVFESIYNKTKCIENTEKLISDNSFIDGEGIISEKLLLKLIKKAKTNRNLLKFMNALVFYLKREELSQKVFDGILSLRGSYKNSIRCGLCHSELSLIQVLKLNELGVEEALVRLLLIYDSSDIFTSNDLPYIFAPWKHRKISKYVKYNIDYYINCEKKAELLNWVDKLW